MLGCFDDSPRFRGGPDKWQTGVEEPSLGVASENLSAREEGVLVQFSTNGGISWELLKV